MSDWRTRAADWLDSVADTQDAEGLTDEAEIEVARRLAAVLRADVKLAKDANDAR